jgi:cell division protein FtsB
VTKHKHSTSTIPRPAGARDGSGGSARPHETHEPGDHTRLIQRRRNRQFFGVGVALIVAAIIGALLVLPIRAWQSQKAELAARERELVALESANARVEADNERLRSPEGVAESARGDLGFRESDELVIGLLPPGPPSAQLPPGWPYSVVSDIFAVRTNLAAEAAVAAVAASSTTVAPTPEPAPPADPTVAASADPTVDPAVPPTTATG